MADLRAFEAAKADAKRDFAEDQARDYLDNIVAAEAWTSRLSDAIDAQMRDGGAAADASALRALAREARLLQAGVYHVRDTEVGAKIGRAHV